MKLYGIPNCDTVKKAISWLKANDIAVDFHDYKKSGITKQKLLQWGKAVGWEKLVNKKSTTWRALPPEQQAAITNQTAAITLMMENPSVIKRPVIETGNKLLVGFNETEYQQTLFSLRSFKVPSENSGKSPLQVI